MHSRNTTSAFHGNKRWSICALWEICISQFLKFAHGSIKQRRNTNPMKVKFTRVPNSILTTLITRDFTKRQTKIVLLVLRLTYGCQVPWAFYEKRYFQVAGLHRGAIGNELATLCEMRVLDMDEDQKVVRVNPRVDAWQCSRNENINADAVSDLMREMISKQLRNVPVLRTLPDEKLDEIDDSEFASRTVKKLKKGILKKDKLFLDTVKIHEQLDWRMPH